jgi:uncharacterized membrane protein
MEHQAILIVLRLLHIMGGVFWLGATIVFARFLLPSMRAVGPAGAPLMRELSQRRKLPMALNGAAMVTVLSGFALYWMLTSMSAGAFARSRMGMTLGLGGVLALVATVIGVTMSRPAGLRMGVLGAEIAASGGPPSAEQKAELERLQNKLAVSTNLVAGLLTIVGITMAVARYL